MISPHTFYCTGHLNAFTKGLHPGESYPPGVSSCFLADCMRRLTGCAQIHIDQQLCGSAGLSPATPPGQSPVPECGVPLPPE